MLSFTNFTWSILEYLDPNETFLYHVIDIGSYLYIEPEGAPPTIIESSPEEIYKTVGDKAEIKVKGSGYPLPSATWYKGDNAIEKCRHYDITSKEYNHQLVIRSLTEDDDEEYTCELKNKHGQTQAIFSVIIEQAKSKPKFIEKLQDQSATEGEELELVVKIESNPEANIEWRINDQIITENKQYEMLKDKDDTYILVIDTVKADEQGTVTCKAENELGSVSCKAKLQVKPKPKGITVQNESRGEFCKKRFLKISQIYYSKETPV